MKDNALYYFSTKVSSSLFNYSFFLFIYVSIICSFIHAPFPPLSSFYYPRHTNPFFCPSFSSPFRWKLHSYSFWQWHIAAVCHYIPSTQYNVLANSPCVYVFHYTSSLLSIQHPSIQHFQYMTTSLSSPLQSLLLLVCIIVIINACLSLSGLKAS